MRLSLLLLIIVSLSACNLGSSPEPTEQVSDAPTTTPSLDLADQEAIIPYWQSFGIDAITPTEDDYVFIEQLVLRRMTLEADPSGDVSSDLQSALGTLIGADNIWQANELYIDVLTVEGDLATVALTGEVQAVGGAILSIVPTQFFLTIFEQVTINRAIVTLNGEALYNIGIANDTQARPADFVTTREAFFSDLSQD